MLLELGCGFIELLGSIIMYGGVSMAFLMSSLPTSAALLMSSFIGAMFTSLLLEKYRRHEWGLLNLSF
jgi:hypothetical protein